MKIRLNRRDMIWSGITMAVATGALVAGCGSGSPQLDDLNNVNPSYPNGAGFATTTRDAAGAIMLVPEWDKFCASQIGKQATQNGQP